MAVQKGRLVKTKGNLTGGQIHQICDKLLFDAIEPLFLYTTALDYLPYQIMNVCLVYPKRKLSSHTNDELVNTVLYSYTQKKPDAWVTLKQATIERSVWIKHAYAFLTEVAMPYLKQYRIDSSTPSIRELDRFYGANGTLHGVCQHLFDGLTRFFEFRDSIAEQYFFLAYKTANIHWKNRTKPTNRNDLNQGQLAMITKALDRYDSTKGALTSYLKLWLKNSLAQGSHTEGLAYDVPNSVRLSQAIGENITVNFGVSLSAPVGEDGLSLGDTLPSTIPTPQESIESKYEVNRLLMVIKTADRGNTYRLLNDIPEVFTSIELETMKAHMIDLTKDRNEH